MGLSIVSLTVRNVADKQGYLEALGRPRTAQVKRDAIRGEAEAEREAKAARYEADLAIEASRRDYETERARFKAEGLRASAEADLSYELQQAITRQQVRAEELKVEIVERQKSIELMQAEVERRKRELEAEIVEPALARAREITAVADAHREESRRRAPARPTPSGSRGWPRPRRWPRRRAAGATTTRPRSRIACSRSCPRWRRPWPRRSPLTPRPEALPATLVHAMCDAEGEAFERRKDG